MLTGEQLKAARALVRMEMKAVAEAAGLSFDTVKRLEMFRGPISANTNTEAALRRAFRDVGVIFIDENGEGYGVRLRKIT
jgi:transcriptional regulator with XRE-family HTH domain